MSQVTKLSVQLDFLASVQNNRDPPPPVLQINRDEQYKVDRDLCWGHRSLGWELIAGFDRHFVVCTVYWCLYYFHSIQTCCRYVTSGTYLKQRRDWRVEEEVNDIAWKVKVHFRPVVFVGGYCVQTADDFFLLFCSVCMFIKLSLLF